MISEIKSKLEQRYLLLADLKGFKRFLRAFFFGGVSALAFAPTFITIAYVIGYTALAWLIFSSASRKQMANSLFGFFFGQYFVGFYWISISLLTEPEKFAWMIPFSSSLLPIFISLLFAVPLSLLYGVITKASSSYGKILIISAALSLSEVARTYVLTGFPWNLSGYIFSFHPVFMQTASIWGIWGLSLIAILFAALPSAMIENHQFKSYRPLILSGMIILSLAVFGILRMSNAPTEYADSSRVRIVQGNISQHHKWQDDLLLENLQKYVELTSSAGLEKVTHIVWPESAIPYIIEEGAPVIRYITSAILNGQYLVSGSMRAERKNGEFNIWNSLHVFSKEGIIAEYDKVRLVPFGEYVPFRGLLPINKITAGTKDFSRGNSPKTINIFGLPPFSPLICYEAIYPVGVIDKKSLPHMIITVTNDAWFGLSSGPFQHMQMARLRAVEYGVPVIRAANTGISGIFDSYGRVIKTLPLNQAGIIDSEIPKHIEGGTLFSKNQYIGYILLLITTIVAVSFRRIGS